jgi:hypothetical protein
MALQLAQLFETPVVIDTVPNSESLNEELRRSILERKMADPGDNVPPVVVTFGAPIQGSERSRIDRAERECGASGLKHQPRSGRR